MTRSTLQSISDVRREDDDCSDSADEVLTPEELVELARRSYRVNQSENITDDGGLSTGHNSSQHKSTTEMSVLDSDDKKVIVSSFGVPPPPDLDRNEYYRPNRPGVMSIQRYGIAAPSVLASNVSHAANVATMEEGRIQHNEYNDESFLVQATLVQDTNQSRTIVDEAQVQERTVPMSLFSEAIVHATPVDRPDDNDSIDKTTKVSSGKDVIVLDKKKLRLIAFVVALVVTVLVISLSLILVQRAQDRSQQFSKDVRDDSKKISFPSDEGSLNTSNNGTQYVDGETTSVNEDHVNNEDLPRLDNNETNLNANQTLKEVENPDNNNSSRTNDESNLSQNQMVANSTGITPKTETLEGSDDDLTKNTTLSTANGTSNGYESEDN